MKTKILFGGWLLSILIIIILGTYIVKSEPKCERKHLDEIDRSKELVPDEETALKIADAIISGDKDVEWDEDFTYEVSVSFDEETYEWLVMYAPTIPGKVVFDGENISGLEKIMDTFTNGIRIRGQFIVFFELCGGLDGIFCVTYAFRSANSSARSV